MSEDKKKGRKDMAKKVMNNALSLTLSTLLAMEEHLPKELKEFLGNTCMENQEE